MHFTFSPIWIASEENWLADALSRFDNSRLTPRLHAILARPRPAPSFREPPPIPSLSVIFPTFDITPHPFALYLPPDVDANDDSLGVDDGAARLVVCGSAR